MSANHEKSMNRCLLAAVLLLLTVVGLILSGCVANDDTSMPWNSPSPGEGNRLPASLMRE